MDEITRDEFEHLIAEIEAFKDNYMEEFQTLSQKIEILEETLKELKDILKEKNSEMKSHRLI